MTSSGYASIAVMTLNSVHPCKNSLWEPNIKNSAVTILILFNGFLLSFAQTTSNTSKLHMNARITKENNNEITNGNSVGETTQGKKTNIRF